MFAEIFFKKWFSTTAKEFLERKYHIAFIGKKKRK